MKDIEPTDVVFASQDMLQSTYPDIIYERVPFLHDSLPIFITQKAKYKWYYVLECITERMTIFGTVSDEKSTIVCVSGWVVLADSEIQTLFYFRELISAPFHLKLGRFVVHSRLHSITHFVWWKPVDPTSNYRFGIVLSG